MAIDGFRVDEPLYISSAGAADEASIQHNGIDFLINNDTGLTKLGNGVSYKFVFDQVNERIGIGTATPSHGIHIYGSAAKQCVVEYAGGPKIGIYTGATYGFVGLISNHNLRILTNDVMKAEIDTAGNMKIPAAYTTIIGGTNIDLYCDNTGLLGPNPSSIRFKENIRNPDINDTKWIFQVPIKKYDMKPARGGEKDKIGVIAEDMEPVNKKVIRYGVHEVTESGPTLLNNAEYDLNEAVAGLKLNIESENFPVYRFALDSERNTIKIKQWKKLILLPISVNLTDFIIPMLKEMQELRKEVDILKNG